MTFAMKHISLKLCIKTECETIKYSGGEQGPPLSPSIHYSMEILNPLSQVKMDQPLRF